MPSPLLLDVIGDVHGHLDALTALCRQLGYAVDNDWSHPEGRLLLFMGDLIDRGPASLEVSERVAGLVAADRALCLLGNHEYNLVGWHQGHQPVRDSNRQTIADVQRRRPRWEPLLDVFAALPMALRLPGLRVIHAVWHEPCMRRVSAVLGSSTSTRAEASNHSADRASAPAHPGPAAATDGLARPIDRLRAAVVLGSPFRDGALVPGLPRVGVPPAPDRDHEILIKGFEEPAPAPISDSEGKQRDLRRVCWWQGDRPEIPRDGVTVFGHYWCLPPSPGAAVFAPPYPTGHPGCLRWQTSRSSEVSRDGRCPVPAGERFVCVDYNGMLKGRGVGCVGAYRWPEHEVAWATDGTA